MGDNEDYEFVASEHDLLISAVSKLDKTQHITEPTRSEPTNLNSEFNLIKTSDKLNLNNVVKVLEDTAHHAQITKKLKKSQDSSKVLRKPLEKPQAERIKRLTAYTETKKKLGRWDPVVARNRSVDVVSFPLKQANNKLQSTKEFISKLKLKSPLEKELEEVDPPQAVVDENDDEEEQMYPMSYQEMVEHRQHIAKMRAQQSYKAAKFRRQSKIKSKKYHRVLKKEKMKQQLKEFEELQKTNPEEALKKLEALEKARALERHTLRHKNTGKWAKSKLVRAKYDKEVRQQIAEQLSVNRSLTQKTQDVESTDDDGDDDEVIPDILLPDPVNPWMMKTSNKSNVDAEFDFGYKKYVNNRIRKHQDDDSDSNDDESNGDNTNHKDKTEDFKLKSLKESTSKMCQEDVIENINIDPANKSVDIKNQTLKKPSNIKQFTNYKTSTPVATSIWMVEPICITSDGKQIKYTEEISTAFESFENNLLGKVDKKLVKLRKDIANLKDSKSTDKVNKDNLKADNLEYLKFKNKKLKPIIDEELIETVAKSVEDTQSNDKPLGKILNITQTTVQDNTDSNIDPSRFIEAKPKYLNTALTQGENNFDQLDDDEQVVPKVNIEEVFEEDDVVASFRQEKEEEINKDQPKDIDLSLPGWGNWGGKGVKAPKRKRNRFILKAAPKMPRKDENKGDVIIKEFRNPKLIAHKVTDVPFPFTSIKEYEASIRTPLGNTFIPEKAHKQLIQPSVITKAGTIIEPMDEEELLMERNHNFKNDKAFVKLTTKK